MGCIITPVEISRHIDLAKGGYMYRQIINSVLDNDLYAFTMSQAALNQYPDVVVDDILIIRKQIVFPEGFAEELRRQIKLMANLNLSVEQAEFLKRKCYYLKSSFVEWFRNYRYDPSEVEVSQEGGHLEVKIHGKFCRTAFWETPLMALISELYYLMTGKQPDKFYVQRAEGKGRFLRRIGARFSEFGTRRRFSWEVQKNVLAALIRSAGLASDGGVLNGTSNVQLAMDFDITPMGTNAHKWYQLHAGLFGIRMANRMANDAWQREFDTRLGITLTDTFTTDEFLHTFDRRTALLYDGVRQDSGDPFKYVDKIVEHYERLGIKPTTKTILFSDSLNTETVEKLVLYCAGKINCAFGIGTFFSNDIIDVEPLKIVIKQVAVYLAHGRRVPTVKISDDPGKASGDPVAIEHAKYDIGLF